MARTHYSDRPDEPEQQVTVARVEWTRRRTILTLGAMGTGAIVGIAGVDALSHPNRGKAINPFRPNETYDGGVDIPDVSFINSRDAMAYFVPNGMILQHVVGPWVDAIAPTPLTYGAAIINGNQKALGVVLSRNAGVQVLGQGQLVSVFNGSLFAGAGDKTRLSTQETPMTLYTPWSARADSQSGFAIVARTNDFKGQLPTRDNGFRLPSSAVPADFQTDYQGHVKRSPFNATVTVDKQARTIVGRLHTVIGLYNGMLIESPSSGSMNIYNPINDGVWNPSQLCAQVSTDKRLGYLAWTPGGTGQAHLSSEGDVTMPLYIKHDASLSSMGSSLENFFGTMAPAAHQRILARNLQTFTYNNDWAVAKEMVPHNSKSQAPALSFGNVTPILNHDYIMNEQTGWSNQPQLSIVQLSRSASL